jgi:hypothetical protein
VLYQWSHTFRLDGISAFTYLSWFLLRFLQQYADFTEDRSERSGSDILDCMRWRLLKWQNKFCKHILLWWINEKIQTFPRWIQVYCIKDKITCLLRSSHLFIMKYTSIGKQLYLISYYHILYKIEKKKSVKHIFNILSKGKLRFCKNKCVYQLDMCAVIWKRVTWL